MVEKYRVPIELHTAIDILEVQVTELSSCIVKFKECLDFIDGGEVLEEDMGSARFYESIPGTIVCIKDMAIVVEEWAVSRFIITD